jgi:hypothetical protein
MKAADAPGTESTVFGTAGRGTGHSPVDRCGVQAATCELRRCSFPLELSGAYCILLPGMNVR